VLLDMLFKFFQYLYTGFGSIRLFTVAWVKNFIIVLGEAGTLQVLHSAN